MKFAAAASLCWTEGSAILGSGRSGVGASWRGATGSVYGVACRNLALRAF